MKPDQTAGIGEPKTKIPFGTAIFTFLLAMIIVVAPPIGIYAFQYHQQTATFKQEYVDRFTTAHAALITAVYDWYGDDHTPEQEEQLSNVILEAYHAADSYETFVRGPDDGLMDSYQWTLVAIKQTIYYKTWKAQGSLLTALLHHTYAEVKP